MYLSEGWNEIDLTGASSHYKCYRFFAEIELTGNVIKDTYDATKSCPVSF